MSTNTRQEELDCKLDHLLSWDFDGKKEPLVFADPMRSAIKSLVNSEVTAVLDELKNRARMLNHNGELLSLNGEPMKVVSLEAIQQLKQRYGGK